MRRALTLVGVLCLAALLAAFVFPGPQADAQKGDPAKPAGGKAAPADKAAKADKKAGA